MTTGKSRFCSLLGIITLNQAQLTATFPLMTLIFFDTQSRLFAADVSTATRSLWYGLAVGLPSIINLFFAPALSALSDEFGRKKILFIEIANASLFTLLTGLGIYTGSLALVFAGFIIKGAFSRSNPTAIAMVGDTTPRTQKVLYMGYLQFAISVGAAIGPLLGSYFASRYLFTRFNFSLPFFIVTLLGCVNAVLVIFLLRETLTKKAGKRFAAINFTAIKKVLTHRDVLFISLILLLIQLSWSTYYQFIPPLLKTIYAFPADQLGFFIGMIAFWLALASSIGVKFVHTFFNTRQILLISIALVTGGLVLSLLCCLKWLPPIWAWISAVPVASGDVIAYSCLTALYSNLVAQEEQGKVMSVNFIVVSLAWSFTGFVGGMLMSLSPVLPLLVAPLGVLVAFLLVQRTVKKPYLLAFCD